MSYVDERRRQEQEDAARLAEAGRVAQAGEAAAAAEARAQAERLAAADYTSVEAECDVVMKGGITSGVVYPLAVCQLATAYRLRNVGGASAGAIAAAAAAAAEFGRDSGGYGRLAEVPAQLGGTLERLFQPSEGTRPLHRVLMSALDPSPRLKRLRIAAAAIAARPLWFLLGAAVVLLPPAVGLLVTGDWWLLALLVPLAVAVGLLGVVAGLAWCALKEVPDNHYGICSGRSPSVEALTDWLHRTLQDLAGPAAAPVLTLRHLWGPAATAGGEPRDRRINLEMMTTNLTFGRDQRLPFRQERWMFCRDELGRLFPDDVVEHLVATGGLAAEPEEAGGGPLRCAHCGAQLHDLPPAPDLPVVLLARMSLSFPVLISAVPLHTIDFDRAPERRLPVRCWFSDGGITSNFPIHFFDSLWPTRPTFGIGLEPVHPDRTDELVTYHGSSRGGIEPQTRAISSLPGFVSTILDTMQNWSDRGQATVPGFRDRLSFVHLHAFEGGMNLRMPPDRIATLAERGRRAAAVFVPGGTFEFSEHRWYRFRTAMDCLDSSFDAMALDREGWKSFLAGVPERTPPGITKTAIAAAESLMELQATWSALDPGLDVGAPAPRPALRITPRP